MRICKKALSVVLCLIMLFSNIAIGEDKNISLFDFVAPKAYAAESHNAGDIIEFGSYPQSEITDEDLLSQLNGLDLSWESYRYKCMHSDGTIAPSDYMRFADVLYQGEKYRAVTFDLYRRVVISEIPSTDVYCDWCYSDAPQSDNKYYYGRTYWFKYEPIKWRVLDPSLGLIVSTIILDAQFYKESLKYDVEFDGHTYSYSDPNGSNLYTNYEHSSIRSWLNNDFFNLAFSEAEQYDIYTTQVDNASNSPTWYHGPSCSSNMTPDKVFLPSIADVDKYRSGWASTKGSDYAKCQGLVVKKPIGEYKEKGCSDWISRTAYNDGLGNIVLYDGSVEQFSPFLEGVRPAICLNSLIDWSTGIPAGYTGIYTMLDLANIKNNLAGKYILMNDINLGGVDWTPIGSNSENAFCGVFNGNNHIISNMKISSTNDSGTYGLFGYSSGNISNLKLLWTNITINTDGVVSAGTVCGINDKGKIDNCNVRGKITINANSSDNCYVGALVGQSVSYCTITNSDTYTSISLNSKGMSRVGGILGRCGYNSTNGNSATLVNCKVQGVINVDSRDIGYIGGMVGLCEGSCIFQQCFNYAEINASVSVGDAAIGGIVGYGGPHYCRSNDIIQKCGNAGSLSFYGNTDGGAYVGGVVGRIYRNLTSGEENHYIRECYNSGTLRIDLKDNAPSPNFVKRYLGGIAASFKTNTASMYVNDCFNTGTLKVENDSPDKLCDIHPIASCSHDPYGQHHSTSNCYSVGEIISVYCSHQSSFERFEYNDENCYYLDDGSGDTYYCVPLTSQQLQKAENINGFDFENVWQFANNGLYVYPIITSIKDVIMSDHNITRGMFDGNDYKVFWWDKNENREEVISTGYPLDMLLYSQQDIATSSVYSRYLSVLLASFAETAYDVKRLTKSLKNHEFENITVYNYGHNPNGDDDPSNNDTIFNGVIFNGIDYDPTHDTEVAYSFASKEMVNGEKVVFIIVRGTAGDFGLKGEWLGNANFLDIDTLIGIGPHPNFNLCANHIYEQLLSYLERTNSSIGDVTFAVTGHSKGAGVANLLSVKLLNNGVSKDSLFDYNFACPDVAVDLGYNWNPNNRYDCIFNINNAKDPVSFIPGPFGDLLHYAYTPGLWGKYGISRWFAEDWSDTKLDWEFQAHEMCRYIKYLKTYPDFYFDFVDYVAQNHLIGQILKYLKVACPVDVYVYNSNDNTIASVINNEIQYYGNNDSIFVYLNGEEKTIISLDGSYFTVKLVGNDEGVMDITSADVTINNNAIVYTRSFENIALETDKEFKGTYSPDEGISSIQIFSLDETGEYDAVVEKDGSEVEFVPYEYSKLTDNCVAINNYCGGFSSLTIPNTIDSYTITQIDANAIPNTVEYLTIPSTVKTIDKQAFNKATNIKEIYVAEDNPCFSSVDGVLYSKDKTQLIRCPMSYEEDEIELPSTVTEICGYAFSGTNIDEIELPSSLKTIRSYAFSDTPITTVTIPSSVERIEAYSFANCANLEEVHYNANSAETGIQSIFVLIKNSPFKGDNNLKVVYIGENVTSIPYGLFGYLSGLETINIEGESALTSIKGFAFQGCAALSDVNYGRHYKYWKQISIASTNESLKDAALHCLECDECTWALNKTAKPATCIHTGVGNFICEICEKEKTDEINIDPNNHVANPNCRVIQKATCGKDGTCEYVCPDCGVVVSTGKLTNRPAHSYGSWSEWEEDYTGDTVRHRDCVNCGHQQTQFVPGIPKNRTVNILELIRIIFARIFAKIGIFIMTSK